MKYYLIAGEASGDLHGANLILALSKYDPKSSFRCWGGDKMRAAGGHLVKHYKDLSFMGFLEVLFNLRTILINIIFCKTDIKAYNPDVLIFIDYPGFNLRIAKWAKSKNYKTHYYISPQIWAWKENRIQNIKKNIDFMYVILPFEKEFYEKKHQYNVHFVGHPLLDEIVKKNYTPKHEFLENNNLDHRPIIAILPGSRKQEIQKNLKEMVDLADDFLEYQFVIAGVSTCHRKDYSTFQKSNVKLIFNQTYNLLSVSTGALVTSGTATLEAALFKVPEVVCYKGSYISYFIAKKVITLKYISLVNLIMNREIVKELIQNKLTKNNLKKELFKILDPKCREKILKNYSILETLLGGSGASKNTAQLILKHSREK